MELTKKKILEILSSCKTHEQAADRIFSFLNPVVDFDFERFLLWFNSFTGKRIRKLDNKAIRQITKLMADGYTKNELMMAVKNCAEDKYHKENRQYLTPEFISREDKFIKYLNYGEISVPDDWYNRYLTQKQQEALTPEQLHQWNARRVSIEMEGGKLKPIKI